MDRMDLNPLSPTEQALTTMPVLQLQYCFLVIYVFSYISAKELMIRFLRAELLHDKRYRWDGARFNSHNITHGCKSVTNGNGETTLPTSS